MNRLGSLHFCTASSDGKANLTLMYTDDLVKNGPTPQPTSRLPKLIQGGGVDKLLATAGARMLRDLMRRPIN